MEDNADLSAYLKRKLQGEYRILTAASAERALELLRQQEADLVLSDIALNGMSGLELCKRICGDFETSHIPVILLSALSSTRSKVVGMECGREPLHRKAVQHGVSPSLHPGTSSTSGAP